MISEYQKIKRFLYLYNEAVKQNKSINISSFLIENYYDDCVDFETGNLTNHYIYV